MEVDPSLKPSKTEDQMSMEPEPVQQEEGEEELRVREEKEAAEVQAAACSAPAMPSHLQRVLQMNDGLHGLGRYSSPHRMLLLALHAALLETGLVLGGADEGVSAICSKSAHRSALSTRTSFEPGADEAPNCPAG